MNFRTKLAMAVIGLCAAFSAPASATPITYNFALTPTVSNVGGGSGSFTINGPINPFFQGFGINTGLQALSFNIDGHTFDLSDATSALSEVDFFLGNLSSIAYAGVDGNFSIGLGSLGLGYTYTDFSSPRNPRFSIGLITNAAVVRSTAVPEPLTLALFGTGLAGVAAIRRRRKAVQA